LLSRSIFDLAAKKDRLDELERQTLAPDFWSDAETATLIQKEHGQLQEVIKAWNERWKELEDTELFLEMVMEEKDAELELEIAEKIVAMEKEQRARRCMSRVELILKEENCVMEPVAEITRNGARMDIKIVAMDRGV